MIWMFEKTCDPPPNETPRRAPNAIIAPPAPATSPKRPELARTPLLCLNVSTQKHFQYTNLVASYMSHSQMLGKVESGGGPTFKVVLEC